MKIFPGKFDPETRTITVTFREGDIVHKRVINAVVDADGNYDKAATRDIIDQQARGIANKIALGVFGRKDAGK